MLTSKEGSGTPIFLPVQVFAIEKISIFEPDLLQNDPLLFK